VAKYYVPIPKTALSTTADLVTIIPPSGGRFRVVDWYLGGMDTTSTANDVGFYRSTAGTTGASGITPTKTSTNSPAASSTVWTAWTTQPTLGAKIMDAALNSNGGAVRMPSIPDGAAEFISGTDQLSVRSVSGTGNVAGWLLIEENW
jgi:hypothetical protein